MASSVSGVNSNAASSIYGNRNVISGLASGMDTESMIENAVSGIRTKITNLQRQRTGYEWKQEAMRSVISKMVKFSQKYTSYTSSTNLFSSSFFSNAVLTSTNGSNASKVSAAGKTASSITIDKVSQIATSARYTVGGDAFGVSSSGNPTITGTEAFDPTADIEVSTMSGNMTLVYGKQAISLNFGELDTYTKADGTPDLEALKKGIEEKLSKQTITLSTGETVKASDRIKVDVDDTTGEISFSDKSSAGNSVVIAGATGDLATKLGLEDAYTDKPSSFTVAAGTELSKTVATGEYLEGKTLKITLDGKTKTITLPKYNDTGNAGADKASYISDLNTSLSEAFGGKMTATLDSNNKLSITTTTKGSAFSIESEAGKMLGIGSMATSYVNMSKTLDELGMLNGLTGEPIAAIGTKITTKDGKDYDEAGYRVVKQASDGKYVRADEDGNAIEVFDLQINGKSVGKFTKDTALESVITSINSNTEAGVKVTYSKTTNQFQFVATETGANGKIEFGAGLAANMFGGVQVPDGAGGTKLNVEKSDGKDAIFSMTVNGQTFTDITRSDNLFDVDGLKITLNGTFDSSAVDGGDKVSFTSKTDSDKIVDAIKTMVEDYNEMMKEIKTQYATLPAQKSNGGKYEPLSDEEMADMSETAIKGYEEKAKQGILFGDSDLSSLYSKMASIFAPGGTDGSTLRAMGITTEYSATDGTTIKLDETALRGMLETNPDGVKDAFTKTKENGAATNGVMQNLKTQLDNYAKTTGEKGILINKAGSPLAPTSINSNSMQKSILSIDKQIERWQDKLSDKIDLYTSKFTQLEKLIAQMNSQSSTLMGMMGGTG